MLAIMLVGASLAYFTDEKQATNTFTVGNVSIDLLESTLHRVNANTTDKTNPLYSDVAMKGTATEYKDAEGKTYTYWEGACYTDDQIKADAETYQSEYLADANIAPGTGYKKMPYVVNTGKNDAYVRIRVIIPVGLDGLLDDSMYTGSAMSSGEFTYEKDTSADGKNYEYTFTRVEALAATEMTFWNVWGTIQMDKDVTNADITTAVNAGLINGETGEFNVIVEADAIQADGFADAAAAWAAFDAK